MYKEIKKRLGRYKFWKLTGKAGDATHAETTLMGECVRKGDYYKDDGTALDFDSVLQMVVDEVWGHYDMKNSGSLSFEEFKQLTRDTLKEMNESGINIKFTG